MNKQKVFRQVIKKFDAKEGFTQGHQILVRRTREHAVPEWTLSDSEVRKVIMRAFPLLKTSSFQRNRAARWARIIHLYFRTRMTASEIAGELGSTRDTVKTTIRNISRVQRGLRADGSGTRKSNAPL